MNLTDFKGDIEKKESIISENFHKKRKKLIASCLIGLALAGGTIGIMPKKANAWGTSTHKFIVNQSIICMRNDKSDIAKYLYEDNGAQTLIDYAADPDIYERDLSGPTVFNYSIGSFRGHFYDPATGTNYRGETSPTANQRFCDHYNLAVKAYKTGSKTFAWQELSRAIHYLSDMNEPHHSNGIAPLDTDLSKASFTHLQYENWTDGAFYNYGITSTPQGVYDYATANNCWQIGHDTAKNSHGYIYLIGKQYYENDINNRKMAANGTIPYAQRIASGIIYKFLKDVGK